MALNSYQKLLKAKSKQCDGKATAAEVKKAATEYVKTTVAKGNKTKTEAEKAANKITNRPCSVAVGGVKKKRKKPAKKTTKRK